MRDDGVRQYTEKEVSRILRRATELQSASAPQSIASGGVRLDELERIAAEVGIDPAHLRSAADELDTHGLDDSQTRWLGAPPEYEIERIVDANLTEEAWQGLVGELNSIYKQSLPGVSAGHVRTWHWKHDLGSVHFTAVHGKSSVRLKLLCHIDDGIAVALIPTVILLLASVMGILAIDELQVWFRPIVAMLAFAAVATSFKRLVGGWFRNDRKRTARAMDKLEGALRESASGGTAVDSAATGTTEPLVEMLSEGG